MSSLEWLNNAFMYVLEYSFYAAMIAFVVFIIRALLAKRFPAMFSYALWGIVLIRLLIPVSLPLPTIFDFSKAQESQGTQTPDESEIVTVGLQDIDYNGQTATDNTQNLSQNIKSESNTNPTASKRTQQYTFDPSLLLGTMWLLGAAALLSRTAILYLYTSRRLKDAVPLDCHDLAKECAAMVGVHCVQDICISAQFQAPVLFGILRPRIILPVSAIDMSKTQLKHVLLHEMVHKKRGDMWLKALWTVVLYVNWFNPILWFADPLYSRDMERACDEHVIRLLGLDSKKAYAISLLNVALNMNQNTTSDKALAFAKGNVKRRIEGVLSLKRFSKAMTALSLAIVLCLCVVMIAACQPTPEEPVVIGKADDTLESALAATAAPITNPTQTENTNEATHMVVTEHWTDSTASKLTTVNIDADVIVPNVMSYPVFEVSPLVVDQPLAEKFVNYVAQDAKEIYNGDKNSKESLEEGIVWLQNKIAQTKAGNLDPDDEMTIEERLAQLEAQLEEHEKEYAKVLAQGETSGEPLDYTFEQELGFPERTEVCFTADMNDGSSRLVRFERCNDGGGPKFSLIAVMDVDEFQERKGKPVSTEKARETALEVVNSLEIGEFALAAEKKNNLFNELVFYRLFDGIPVTAINASQGNSSGVCTEEELTYNFVLWQESLCIYVNDTGVILIDWTSPCNVTRTVNENVALKPIEEIKEIFKQQILYNVYEADGNEDIIKIDEVRLGYMAIPEKGDISNYRLIPVWDFIGPTWSDEEYAAITNPQYLEEGSSQIPNEDISYLTINAIDGSIIDRNLGY